MSIEISASFADLRHQLDGLDVQETAIKRATASALNKTAISVRAEAIRLIRKDYNVKASSVRDVLAISKATVVRPEARITGAGSPGIPLVSFSPLPSTAPSTKRSGARYIPALGISVIVRKGSRKTVTGSFVAMMRSGHVGVFQRTAGMMRGGKKQKIKELFGPSPIKILATDKYAVPLDDFAGVTLDKNMEHEVEYFRSRTGGR